MKKEMKKMCTLYICISLSICCFFGSKTHAEEGQIGFTILQGDLLIRGSGNIQIGTIAGSATTGEKVVSISPNFFQLQDRKTSCSGYYTTIQGDNFKDGGNSISSSYASFRTTSLPNIIDGYQNTYLTFGSGIYPNRNSIQLPKTYFLRNNNQGCTIVGQYGDPTSEFKITIPANQPSGNYRTKIYYLLIDTSE